MFSSTETTYESLNREIAVIMQLLLPSAKWFDQLHSKPSISALACVTLLGITPASNPNYGTCQVQILSLVGSVQEAVDAFFLPLPLKNKINVYIYLKTNKPAFSQVPPSETVYFLVDMI